MGKDHRGQRTCLSRVKREGIHGNEFPRNVLGMIRILNIKEMVAVIQIPSAITCTSHNIHRSLHLHVDSISQQRTRASSLDGPPSNFFFLVNLII